MSSLKRFALAIFVFVFVGAGIAPRAAAEDAASFYKGQQVTVIVPTGPGGGYALYGQIFSRYFGKHIPGQPTVIIKYMPGAGGNVAANYLYNAAPKDGTVVALLFSTLTVTQALQPTGAQFDATKFSWLGSIAPMINGIGIWHKAPTDTLAGAKQQQVVMGATGKSADLYIYPQIMNAVLGTKFKIVMGYDSSGAILLAMQSGEVQGMAMGLEAWYATRPEWMKNKEVNIIAQNGIKRDKSMPDVPTLVELASNAEDKQVLTFLAAPAVLGRAVAAPPGIPPDRLAALQTAFDETAKDPDLVKDLTSRHLSIDPTQGPQIEQFIEKISATPKPLVEKTKKLLNY